MKTKFEKNNLDKLKANIYWMKLHRKSLLNITMIFGTYMIFFI